MSLIEQKGIYETVVSAWNAQADDLNQWDSLGEDEKIEFTAEYVTAHNCKAACEAVEQFEEGFTEQMKIEGCASYVSQVTPVFSGIKEVVQSALGVKE